jgi:hypothetical protein
MNSSTSLQAYYITSESQNLDIAIHTPLPFSPNPDEDLNYDDYEDDEETEDEEELRDTLKVDFLAFETRYNPGRLYHRDFLLRVAREKADLIAELAKPKAERTLKFFSHRTYKLWNTESFLDTQAREPKNVLVEFLTEV